MLWYTASMGFGKRGPDKPPAVWTRPAPEVTADQASALESIDFQLLDAAAAKYEVVRDAVIKAISEMDASNADGVVGDVQRAIDDATNSDQGSKLAPENVRKYLERKRPKGRGR